MRRERKSEAVAVREGAEYVGDLGTFNGARLAASTRKGIRYFPLFTAFRSSFLSNDSPSAFFRKESPPGDGARSKGHR